MSFFGREGGGGGGGFYEFRPFLKQNSFGYVKIIFLGLKIVKI
jgi:hypothetical protein